MSFNEVIVKGGLGNQLFCLFYAYKILLQKNHVTLNLVNYSISKRKDRQFVLDDLFPAISNIFNIKNSNKSYFLILYAKIIEKIFFKAKVDSLPGDISFSIPYWPNNYIHSGYFQKITNTELDKKSLNFLKKQMSPYLNDLKSKFLAIHVRRGDYLEKKYEMHGFISENYLVEESKKLISKEDFDGITIFSDSPDLINLTNFKTLHKNISIDKGGHSIDVFKRMSCHKGLVASNSSFSLWAGLLGDIKIFTLPDFWMRDVKSSVIGLDNIPRYKCYIK